MYHSAESVRSQDTSFEVCLVNFREWPDRRRIRKTTQGPNGIPMAENAKRKHVDNAKVFFNAARRRGLILFNPFEYQVSSTRKNRERNYVLSRSDTEKIIEACPDATTWAGCPSFSHSVSQLAA